MGVSGWLEKKKPCNKRFNCHYFRDDIVFFIFLYQRYIYKEDKTRVNEFGFSGEMLDEMDEQKPEAVTGEEGDQDGAQLAVTDTQEEEEEDITEENTAAEAGAGAWKNSQKQKSKKSKKND